MEDTVIVTLIYGKQEFEMEFPARVSVEKIKPLLIQALRSKGILLEASFRLRCNSHSLENSFTFFECGVWDGCYLELIDGGY